MPQTPVGPLTMRIASHILLLSDDLSGPFSTNSSIFSPVLSLFPLFLFVTRLLLLVMISFCARCRQDLLILGALFVEQELFHSHSTGPCGRPCTFFLFGRTPHISKFLSLSLDGFSLKKSANGSESCPFFVLVSPFSL